MPRRVPAGTGNGVLVPDILASKISILESRSAASQWFATLFGNSNWGRCFLNTVKSFLKANPIKIELESLNIVVKALSSLSTFTRDIKSITQAWFLLLICSVAGLYTINLVIWGLHSMSTPRMFDPIKLSTSFMSSSLVTNETLTSLHIWSWLTGSDGPKISSGTPLSSIGTYSKHSYSCSWLNLLS